MEDALGIGSHRYEPRRSQAVIRSILPYPGIEAVALQRGTRRHHRRVLEQALRGAVLEMWWFARGGG
jgi:hypothetical protein